MFGSLQLFNTVVVRVRQESEGYCSVLDIAVSISSYHSMTPGWPEADLIGPAIRDPVLKRAKLDWLRHYGAFWHAD